MNFTFPHFHFILLHFSADSKVLFYCFVWTLSIIGLFCWIYLFAYMLCLILSWFPWLLLYVVDAWLHPWTWHIRIMLVFFVNPTCSLPMDVTWNEAFYIHFLLDFLLLFLPFLSCFFFSSYFHVSGKFVVLSTSFGLTILIEVLLREPHMSHLTYC